MQWKNRLSHTSNIHFQLSGTNIGYSDQSNCMHHFGQYNEPEKPIENPCKHEMQTCKTMTISQAQNINGNSKTVR